MQTTAVFDRLVAAWAKNPRYIDSEGGTRSGKTYSALQLFILVARYDPLPTINSVVSETMPHLKRGAIRDFKRIMVEEGFWNPDRWLETDKVYQFENGAILEFFSADSPGKVHGPARDRLFVNEAQNIPYEIARQLFVRTRGIIVFDYNPTHAFWAHEKIKSRENCISIHSTYRDNQFLTPEQVAEIESNRADANWWRVYGEGLVGQLEGVIYDFEQIDQMPEADGMIETYGIDFGFTADPTAIVHCLIHTGRRELYLDEIEYRTGMLNRDILAVLREYDVPLHRTPLYADCAEPKTIAEIAQAGYNCKPCYKATRKAEQIAFLKQFKMYVTKQSVSGIRELREYVWATDKDGRQLNEPTPFNDHFCDAFRYGAYTPLSNFRKSGHYNIRIR